MNKLFFAALFCSIASSAFAMDAECSFIKETKKIGETVTTVLSENYFNTSFVRDFEEAKTQWESCHCICFAHDLVVLFSANQLRITPNLKKIRTTPTRPLRLGVDIVNETHAHFLCLYFHMFFLLPTVKPVGIVGFEEQLTALNTMLCPERPAAQATPTHPAEVLSRESTTPFGVPSFALTTTSPTTEPTAGFTPKTIKPVKEALPAPLGRSFSFKTASSESSGGFDFCAPVGAATLRPTPSFGCFEGGASGFGFTGSSLKDWAAFATTPTPASSDFTIRRGPQAQEEMALDAPPAPTNDFRAESTMSEEAFDTLDPEVLTPRDKVIVATIQARAADDPTGTCTIIKIQLERADQGKSSLSKAGIAALQALLTKFSESEEQDADMDGLVELFEKSFNLKAEAAADEAVTSPSEAQYIKPEKLAHYIGFND